MLALALLCLICSAAAEEQESAVEQKVEQEIPVDEPEIHEPTQEEEPAEAKAVEVEQKSPAATDTAVAADERTFNDKGMGFHCRMSVLQIPVDEIDLTRRSFTTSNMSTPFHSTV